MRRLLRCLVVVLTIAIPALVSASDQEVAQKIANKLKGSGQLNGYNVAVKCQNGTVWLKGQVQDEQQAIAALKLALGTPGVERVVNELTSGPTAGTPTAKDSAIKPTIVRSEPSGEPYQGNVQRESGMPKETGRADKLAASFMRASAQPVSAIDTSEPQSSGTLQELPRVDNQRTAQRAMPMAYRQTSAPAAPPMASAPPQQASGMPGPPLPMYSPNTAGGVAPARYDQPCLPNYAWPSYASHPNYAAVTYPKQYSPTAWPYIGPFYPYPQVPLGWRKVTLEWEDGWWMLDFKDTPSVCDGPIGRWY
jgi:hypothetical protein